MTEKFPAGKETNPFHLPFSHKVLMVAFTAALLLLLWQISLVLILIFGGALIAISLQSLAQPLHKWLRIPKPWALPIAILCFVAAILGFLDIFGTLAVQQFTVLYHRLPVALEDVRTLMHSTPFGRYLIQSVPDWNGTASHLAEMLPLAGGILGGLGEGLLVLVVGIYFSISPDTYIHGVLHLLPKHRRPRTEQIFHALGSALRKWLIGMSIDMVLMGTMTFIGLSIIGMPAPFALAVLAGVGVFVPYIGPLITVIPGILLALGLGPTMALYAGIVYIIALTIEGNISQPMLQRWAVSLPPVANLLAILVFSPLFGIWGAVLATPLSISVWVVIRMVYIEDILQDLPA